MWEICDLSPEASLGPTCYLLLTDLSMESAMYTCKGLNVETSKSKIISFVTDFWIFHSSVSLQAIAYGIICASYVFCLY